MAIKDVVYKGAGNELHLVLTDAGRQVGLSTFTRMALTVGATVLDSETAPEVFDFATYPSVLVLKLGSQALPPGIHKCRLKVFPVDYPHPAGLVWADGFEIEVVA
jgi:hypothetical protein